MVVIVLVALQLWIVTVAINYIHKNTRQFYDDTMKYYRNNGIDGNKMIVGNNYGDAKSRRVKRLGMLMKSNKLNVSYPPAEYHRFHESLLNQVLCNQYTLECIFYRSEYPYVQLSFDQKTNLQYNPCHRFVEPCFGILQRDYQQIKKFKNLREYY